MIKVETKYKQNFLIDYNEIKNIVYSSCDGKIWATGDKGKFTANSVAFLADLLTLIPNNKYLQIINKDELLLEVDMLPRQEYWSTSEILEYIESIIQHIKDNKYFECLRESQPDPFTLDKRYQHFNIIIPKSIKTKSKINTVLPLYLNTNYNNICYPSYILELPGTQKHGEVK